MLTQSLPTGRHGDIEDTLLTLLLARAAGGKKFDKLAVSRVYFGNWLRDYSQAIDVGTVKSVSAEAIRLLLCVLGFLTFGYGSKEFEVTADRLGTYRPEDHIGEQSPIILSIQSHGNRTISLACDGRLSERLSANSYL